MFRVYYLVIVFLLLSCTSKVKQEQKNTFTDNKHLNNYWRTFQFTANEVIQVPEKIEQSLVDYITQFPNYSVDSVQSSLQYLIHKSENDSIFFEFLKDKFANYLYHPNSPFRDDLYYEQVLLTYATSPRLKTDERVRTELLLQLIQKNQVGTQAADFDFMDTSNQSTSLYSITSDLKLLFFYDPTCQHCKATIDYMRDSPILNQAITSGRLQVLAIDVVGDFKAWKEYQSQMPSNWLNGYNASGSVQKDHLYNILAYPTIYLLDKNNTVVLKDVYFNSIENYFSK